MSPHLPAAHPILALLYLMLCIHPTTPSPTAHPPKRSHGICVACSTLRNSLPILTPRILEAHLASSTSFRLLFARRSSYHRPSIRTEKSIVPKCTLIYAVILARIASLHVSLRVLALFSISTLIDPDCIPSTWEIPETHPFAGKYDR
jgi:hypothetical protein